LFAGEAVAGSEFCADSAPTLLAWSDDGQAWAVVRDNLGPELLFVETKSDIGTSVGVEPSDLEMDPCLLEPEHVIKASRKRRMRAVRRINLATFPALKKYRLKRIRASWRAKFAKRYVVKKSGKRIFSRVDEQDRSDRFVLVDLSPPLAK